MTNRFQNTYRIPSARASWWDYGSNAAYFVTICSLGRDCYFGEIRNETMCLSEIGKIAQNCWNEIPVHFPFVELDGYVIMPNHVHGILVIDKTVNYNENTNCDVKSDANVDFGSGVETRLIASLQTPNPTLSSTNDPKSPTEITEITKPIGGFAGNKNPMLNDNLSRIMRWYKGRTSFESRKIYADFAWQSRFHDHIIRNEQSYQTIAAYINNNPGNWEDDKFYSK